MSDQSSTEWNPKDCEAPAADSTVSRLLLAWQDEGNQQAFETLVIEVLGDIEDTARSVFGRRRITSEVAIDDVVSLVLDHVRRLRPCRQNASRVQPFDPGRIRSSSLDKADDAGRAYIRWLSQSRALDVCRMHLRRSRHEVTFAALPEATVVDMAQRPVAAEQGPNGEQEKNEQWLEEALSVLDSRSRSVLMLLRAGESQAEIAKRLGVHEGTISRIRMRAIDNLRRRLAARDESEMPQPARQSRRSPR
jgi:RNA polymerase sigma factor (sigma-70 family)